MNINTLIKYILNFFLLLIPSICYADGGGPLLVVLSIYAFTLGQVWILFSETIYLSILLKRVSKLIILWWVMQINFLSTIIGFMYMFILAIISNVGLIIFGDNIFLRNLFTAVGSWSSNDGVGSQTLFLSLFVFNILVTFCLTVFSEKWLLTRKLQKQNINVANISKHVMLFNMISYLGLVSFFIVYL